MRPNIATFTTVEREPHKAALKRREPKVINNQGVAETLQTWAEIDVSARNNGAKKVVEARGLEPLTRGLRVRCSAN
jgi:hypothetical protein